MKSGIRCKNVVCYVTKQYMKNNKRRTFSTFVGIMFMVILMTCVFVGRDTAMKYLVSVAENGKGKWHSILYDVNQDTINEFQSRDYVEETYKSINCGYIDFVGTANKDVPFLQIKAYEDKLFDWMNIKLVEGRLPETSDEIVISNRAINDGATIKIGDKISSNKTYTVVGIIERPYFDNTEGYLAICNINGIAIDEETKVNLSIRYDLDKVGERWKIYRELYDLSLDNYAVNDTVLSFAGLSSDETINVIVKFISIFFVILIMLASVVLIYNLFNMSFKERCQYLGMLSSIGATRTQKRSSIFYEAFSLLLPAIPLGVLFGVVVVWLGMQSIKELLTKLVFIGENMETIPVDLSINGTALLYTVVVCFVTVLISAFIPSRKIKKIGPIECIRGAEQKNKKTYKLNRKLVNRIGAEGMLAVNECKRQKRKSKGIVLATVIFLVILAVTSFGASSVCNIVELRLGEKEGFYLPKDSWNYGTWTYNYTSEDAPAGTKEKLYEIVDSVRDKEEVLNVRVYSEWMDCGSAPDDYLSDEYKAAFYDVAKQYEESKNHDLELLMQSQSINILALPQDEFEEIAGELGADIEADIETDKYKTIVVDSCEISTNNLVIGKRTGGYRYNKVTNVTDYKAGDILSIGVWGMEKNITVQFQVIGAAGDDKLKKYGDFYGDFLWIIVDEKTADLLSEKIADEDGHNGFCTMAAFNIKDKSGYFINQLNSSLSEMYLDLEVNMENMVITLQKTLTSLIRILTICFVLLTSVICLMNLLNVIRSRVIDSRKEFAVLLSIGMTKKQTLKMLAIESGTLLFKSIIWAVILCIPLISIIWKGVTNIFGNAMFKIPWTSFIGGAFLAVIGVLGITILCFTREKHDSIIEDVRRDFV